MGLQRSYALLGPLRFHRLRVLAMAWGLSAPQDVPQGDLGIMLVARPVKQEKERQIVGEDNDLTGPAFLGKPVGDLLAVQVVERGNGIVEHNA